MLEGISSLPVDVLQDSILPLLPPASLVNLAGTNHAFQRLVDGPDGEIVWRRKAEQDFSFPTNNTGRRSGWKELYRRLQRQSVFVWGDCKNGRLGHTAHRARTHLIQGGFPIPTRLEMPDTIVGLEAGGFSFHALTKSGKLLVWGTMDGELGGRGGALSYPGLMVEEPIKLPQASAMGEVVQVEAGRKHVVLRNRAGQVWEYRSFGRVYEVTDANDNWGPHAGPGRSVVAVEAGWSHSLVLTTSGAVYVWWELGPVYLNRLAAEAGERALPNLGSNGVSFTTSVETLKLPDLPSFDIAKGEKVASVAAGDHFVVALTDLGKLFILDISPVPVPGQPLAPHGNAADEEDSPVRGRESRARLDAAFAHGARRWELMDKFCDMDKVRALEVFGEEEGKLKKPKEGTIITSISAHFHSFVAYSVSAASSTDDSLVLMGDDSWTASSLPRVIPELQGKDVIKVVQGDYHYVALTSGGQLYSWGKYSLGALGLGHPMLLNTPLSAPHPPPRAPVPAGGFTTPRVYDPLFPGFTRSHPNPETPRPPDSVDHPTLIRFPGEEDVAPTVAGEKRKGGKFVFHVTASGWHTGCLAIELGDDAKAGERAWEDEEEAELKKAQEEFEAENASQRGAGRGVTNLWRGGRRPFRLGFPARGMRGGLMGFGQPNPAAAEEQHDWGEL